MIKLFIYLQFCLVLYCPLFAFGQQDSIKHYSNYIIYLSGSSTQVDTLNYVDEKGLKQGKWIEYDSSYSQTKSMRSVKYKGSDSLWTHGWIFEDVGDPKYEFRIKICGYYIDGKKQGVWTNSLRKTNINKELFYIDDILQSPVIFYKNNRIGALATFDKKKQKWQVKSFNEGGLKYYTSYHDNLTFFMEAY